jgi:hypothetical protein
MQNLNESLWNFIEHTRVKCDYTALFKISRNNNFFEIEGKYYEVWIVLFIQRGDMLDILVHVNVHAINYNLTLFEFQIFYKLGRI